MAILANSLVCAGMAIAAIATAATAQTSNEQLALRAQAAQNAEQHDDFKTAVQQYQLIVQAMPENAEMQSNLGVALYFDRQYPKAIEAFHKADARRPGMLAPHLFAGLAWFQLSKPDRAVSELQKATEISNADVLAHTWLGYAYIAQGNYQAAAKVLERASILDPDNIDVWYALGQSYLQLGDDATQKLIAATPDSGRVWELAGQQCRLAGDNTQAIEDFKKAAALRPDLPELRDLIVSLGGSSGPTLAQLKPVSTEEDTLYTQARETEEQAEQAFQHILQLAPDSCRAHQVVADSYLAQHKNAEALAEYQNVLRLKPDLPGIHKTIGDLLIKQGKLPEALEEFKAEVQLQPHSAEAHMEVGKALLMMGQDDSALVSLRAAMQMDRPPLETWLLLGKLYVRQRNPDAAITALTHFTAQEKQISTAYFLLATAYRQSGRKEDMNKALDLYRQTSIDAKQRNIAQSQLQSLNRKAIVDDASLEDKGAATQ